MKKSWQAVLQLLSCMYFIPALLTSHNILFLFLSREVLAVGLNANGEVDPQREESDDNMIKRPTIVEALATHLVVSVSCGLRHTACLTSSGTVITYGSNENFACGHPPSPFTPCRVFARAMNLGRRCGAAVACGDRFTMVLTTHMEVLICGIEECCGEVKRKNDDNGDVNQPSLLPSLTGLPITLIVAGSSHALVVTSLGYAYAWGSNPGGCCGLSALPVVHRPTRLRVEPGNPDPVWLKEPPPPCSMFTTTATLSGDPTTGGVVSGVDIPLAEALVDDKMAVVNAAAGRQHTVLITRSGRILCCGRNKSGQCGFDPGQPDEQNICPPREPPIAQYLDSVGILPISRPLRFVCVACGDAHTLLLDDTGDVWQVGTSDIVPSPSWTPARKVSLSSGPLNAFFVAAGSRQSVALSTSGTRASGGGGGMALTGNCASGADRIIATCPLTPKMMMKRNRPNNFVSPEVDLLKHLEELEKQRNTGEGQEQQDGSNGKLLLLAAEELFKRPSVLMNAFYEPESLEHLYKRLLSVGKEMAIVEALTEGIKNGLARFNSIHQPMEEAVRCFLLYWQCPIHVHPARHNTSEGPFLSLCNLITLLTYPGHRALMGWIRRIYPNHLFATRLIYPLQEHISQNIRTYGLNGRTLYVLCSVLNSLHRINSTGATATFSGGQSNNCTTLNSSLNGTSTHERRIVPTTLFYNSTINELSASVLVEDFIRWRQSRREERARAFYLCCFPFLITPPNKMLMLRSEVEFLRLKSGLASFVFVLQVDREHIVQQTIAQIASVTDLAYKMRLRVQFMGEDAVDEGGPRQEFFLLLTSRLFDIDLGMWDEVGDNQLWFNKDCSWNDDAYTLVGIILGLAIYNGALVDVSFPQVLYRKLLGLTLGFEDLYDETARNGLRKLLDYEDGDFEDVFGLNFEVNWQSFGEMVSVELIPGGKNIPVTSENVVDYVKRYVQWTLVDSVKRQFDLFKAGFDRVMRDTSISLLQPEELEDIVVGTKELDIDALERVTQYEGGYDANTPVVRFFWRFLAEADIVTRQKVLRFVTGSKSAPIGGLEKVPFKIQRAGPDLSQLPTSSTCFSILLLPEYGTYEKLCNRLSIAVNQCVGFGLY